VVLVDHGSMSRVIDMNDEKLKTLEQIREFMAGTKGVGFTHQKEPEWMTMKDERVCQIRKSTIRAVFGVSSPI